jgi:hypothetical protein
MGLIMLLAATISAAASSQAEMRTQGNSTNVMIEMNFEKLTKTQLLQAVISQLSSSVFQIVVADEHQACQLARIINSDLSPCFHEQRKENELEDTDAVVFYRNDTSKQRKTAQNARWVPKKHTSISALHPPHATAPKVTGPTHDQAEGDIARATHDQTLNSFNTSNSTPKKLPTTAVPPTKLVPESYSQTLATAPFIPAAHPDVLLQASQDFADHPLQQDLHGTPPHPPTLLHLPLGSMPSVTSHHLCSALTVYCTHCVLHSLCTALTVYSPSSADSDLILLLIPEVTQRRLTACTFDSGLCSNLMQSTDDNFDWTLTNESTPTSNTGPSSGSGGEGAFMFIEADGQNEGAYAAITSSTTGCALYLDYHMYGGGIGTLTVSAKNAADGDDAAWVTVWTKEGGRGSIWRSWQSAIVYLASGSYYQVMATRGAGNRGDIAIDNLNLVACTLAPTLTPTPTNEGDTHVPIASLTAAPTDVPTDVPTYVPTSAPTAAPTMNPPSGTGDTQSPTAAPTAAPTLAPVDIHLPTAAPIFFSTFSPANDWNQLKNQCDGSACNTANSGCTVVLSDDFFMGSYTGEIGFSGKAITIWGQGKLLDTAGGGRFFSGQVGSLELHDVRQCLFLLRMCLISYLLTGCSSKWCQH